MKFNYTKKLRFILVGAYFKKIAEPPILQERPWILPNKDANLSHL